MALREIPGLSHKENLASFFIQIPIESVLNEAYFIIISVSGCRAGCLFKFYQFYQFPMNPAGWRCSFSSCKLNVSLFQCRNVLTNCKSEGLNHLSLFLTEIFAKQSLFCMMPGLFSKN